MMCFSHVTVTMLALQLKQFRFIIFHKYLKLQKDSDLLKHCKFKYTYPSGNN